VSVTVTLSDWLFRAVCARSVLTLSRDYFRLRKPLERRVYELARKHCGRQAEWEISIPVLHHKSGSAAPVRVFRAALRRMIEENHLPEYALAERAGDVLVVTRRSRPRPMDAPVLLEDTLAAARALRPGSDVYALQARWVAWWGETGRPRLQNPDRAFLAWVKTQKDG
jgi:plasmid replication initiation protein